MFRGYLRLRVGVVKNGIAIKWTEFSQKSKDRAVEQGQTVLLFARPTYHVGSELAAQTFQHGEIRRLSQAGRFVAMELEYEDWEGEEIQKLFQLHGQTKNPFGYIYSSKHMPIRIDVYSADDILAKLQ